MSQYKRLLVAVDGSEAAEIALQKGVELAKANQAELFIAHIIDTRAFQALSYYDNETADQATAMATQTLAEYKQLALNAGTETVTTILRYGIPKKVLALHLPKELEIDLTLIGSDQRSLAERILLGSLSKYLKRHSPTKLMIVT